MVYELGIRDDYYTAMGPVQNVLNVTQWSNILLVVKGCSNLLLILAGVECVMNGYTRPRLFRNLQKVEASRKEGHHRLLRSQPGGIWLNIQGKQLPVLLPSRTATSEFMDESHAPWRAREDGGL